MKRLMFSLLLAAMMQVSFAQYNNPDQTVYHKLADVNKEWLKTSCDASLMQHTTFTSDEALIQFHLQQVEARLRDASTTALSATQRGNRAMCLDYLHTYWQTGVFPKNTRHSIRTPYFIDDLGTYCAVGYLLQQSGYSDFAQRIHDENNYAYIHELNYPELLAWAREYGFSVDELAWIQPAYATAPPYEWSPVQGSDVEGAVQVITVDETNEIMYVAAEFGDAGNGIMSFDGTDWNDLDGGVDGTVAVVLVDGQNVIVGGEFTTAGGVSVNSIAVWNGSDWSPLGSGLDGVVRALAYHNTDLYAGGDFVFSGYPSSLAKWDGNAWSAVAGAPQGVVHALQEYKKALYLGGDFTTAGSEKNIVKLDGNGFTDIGGYPTIIRALEVFENPNVNDTALLLYIGGDIATNDSTYEMYGFSYWNGVKMESMISPFSWYTMDEPAYISGLQEQKGRLFITGSNFSYSPMYGHAGQNAVVFSNNQSDTIVGGLAWDANGAIQAAVEFKGAIVLGGEFDSLSGHAVNKLAVTGELETGIRRTEVFKNTRVVYGQAHAVIYLDDRNMEDVSFVLYDATGKLVMHINEVQNTKVEITNQSLASGLYLYTFTTARKQLGAGNLFVR